MARLNPTTMPKVGIQVYVSKEMHTRIIAECGHCGCQMSSFVRNAIAKEIASRQAARHQAAMHAILVGQIDIEGPVHGE